MTTGFKVGTVDLDDWFDPYVQGTKPALTGYKAGAQDLRDRFAPLAFGIKAELTHYNVTGIGDLRELFAKKGTASYALPANGQTAYVAESLTNQQTGYAYAEFVIQTNGAYTFRAVRSPNPKLNDTTIVSSGTWNTLGGAASGYQTRFTVTNVQYPFGNTGITITNNASAFTTVSANQSVQLRADDTFNGGTREVTADVKIELRRIVDGLVFSTTVVHVDVHIDGSV